MDIEVRKVFHMLEELSPLSEEIGDNSVDNMMTELERSCGVEMGKFVGSLLNTNVDRFKHCYNMPEYEPFRHVMRDIISRYQIMAGSEQGDLFLKIENMFKDIMIGQYAHLGPEIAEMIAKKYAVQMIQFIKEHGVTPKDMDTEKDGYY